MHVRIEADADLTLEENAAVQAALQRYAATTAGSAPTGTDPNGWTSTGRREAVRGRAPRAGGQAAWQAARDRRRRTRETAT